MGLSVYIHLPYCRRRCSYCDFNTSAPRTFPENSYIDTVLHEMERAAHSPAWRERVVSTVFFGGGTPSLFSPRSIERLLEGLADVFGIDKGAEITLEANPGTLEGGASQRLLGFRQAGVTRLSLGCQSFNDRHLATLSRIHSAAQAESALRSARGAGFAGVSCDLMFAIPGQTIDDWERDLAQAVRLGPDHVSTYNLTYEEGTRMTAERDSGRIRAVDEETEAAMYEMAISMLAGAGFSHYEISNFARPGCESRHNLAYWQWRDHLGLGAGAHGFGHEHGQGIGTGTPGFRYMNLRDPDAYMSAPRGAWVESSERLTREMATSEFVMLGLRMLAGFEEKAFEETFGVELKDAMTSLGYLVRRGFLERDGGRVRLTRRGLMLADSVLPRLAAA